MRSRPPGYGNSNAAAVRAAALSPPPCPPPPPCCHRHCRATAAVAVLTPHPPPCCRRRRRANATAATTLPPQLQSRCRQAAAALCRRCRPTRARLTYLGVAASHNPGVSRSQRRVPKFEQCPHLRLRDGSLRFGRSVKLPSSSGLRS